MYTLYHGDCLEEMSRIEAGSVDMIVTSPPYWNQKEYSFWPTYESYLIDVELWVKEAYRVLKEGRHCFWVIPDKLPWPPVENGTTERLYKHIYSDTESLAIRAGFISKISIVWLKYQAAQRMFGSYPYPPTIIPTPMTERICVWRKPGKPDLKSKTTESKITLDMWKEASKDIWQIRSPNKKIHPAEFPIEIPIRCITCWSFVGDTVLDLFMGSGSTLEAAMRCNRHSIGIEKDAGYFSVAQQRLERVAAELRGELGHLPMFAEMA